jgi:acyl-CoA synthetase (NDP forming)
VLGVDVATPSEATAQRLKAAGVAAEPGRILDLTLAGARYDIMRAALETLLAAPEFALVVAVVGSSAQFNPELAVKPIIDCAGHATPIAVFLTPHADQTLRLLAEHGVAAFRTPEACADGIAAYLRWRPPVAATSVDERALAAARAVLDAAPGEVLDELQSCALFEALGIPAATSVRLELDGALRAPLPFPFPVAAKVLSADIAHKTDAGGVALGIASPEELVTRVAALVAAVRERRPDARLDGILVQPMTGGVAEVLAGYRLDPQVGPVVTVGMGGTLAEIYRDFALRLAPVSPAEASEMIAEVRGLAVLRGFRGRPAGDVAALADAIARVSLLARLPAVIEAEINPLIVKPAGGGVIAVDGLVRRSTG